MRYCIIGDLTQKSIDQNHRALAEGCLLSRVKIEDEISIEILAMPHLFQVFIRVRVRIS